MTTQIETQILRSFAGVSTIIAGTGMFTSCSSISGNFMLFTIDQNSGVNLIQLSNSFASSPYTLTSLTDQSFLTKYKAVTICSMIDRRGFPLLGGVFNNVLDNNIFEFFSCQNFDAQLEDGKERWISHGIIICDKVTGLSAGKSKTGLPVLLAQVRIKNDVKLFYFDGTNTGAVETPLASDGIIRAEISNNAKLSSLNGVDFLGLSLQKPTNQNSILTATSMPDREYYNHQIPIDGDTSTITVTDGISDSSLFVAGNNVYYYPPDLQVNRNNDYVLKHRVQINSSINVLDHPIDLQATKDSNNLHHLWILQQNGLLAYSYETEEHSFSDPFNMCSNITSFASHTDPSGVVHLFTLSANNELRHHIMDRNHNWSDALIQIPNNDQVEEVVYCVSTITFNTNEEHTELPVDVKFSVSSSAPAIVKVNGIAYVVDSSQYVSIPWPNNGIFTVSQQVKSTSIERLKINCDLFIKPIELTGSVLIAKRLATVTGDDLRNGNIADAKSNANPCELLVGADAHYYCDDAAANFQILSQQLIAFSNAGSPSTLNSAGKFLIVGGAVEAGLIVYSENEISSYFAPPNTDAADTMQIQLQQNPEEACNSSGVFGWIIKSIREGVSKVVNLAVKVVGGVVHLAIQIGKTIYTLLSPILDPLFTALEWVWDTIKVGLKAALKWVAELIGFDDILITTRQLKRTFNEFIDTFALQILPKLANASDNMFKEMEEHFVENPIWIDPLEPINPNPDSKNYLNDPKMSIAVESASEPNARNGTLNCDVESSSDMHTLILTIDSIFNDLADVVPNLKQAWDECSNGSDIMNLFKFINIVLLELCRTAVKEIIKLLSATLQLLKIYLNSSSSLPIIGPLYKLLTGETISALDVLCFLAAFPITLISKAVNGSAPFDNDINPMDTPMYRDNLNDFLNSSDTNRNFIETSPPNNSTTLSNEDRIIFKNLCISGECCSLFATLFIPFDALTQGESGFGILSFIGTGLTAINYVLKFIAYFYITTELKLSSKIIVPIVLAIGLGIAFTAIVCLKSKLGDLYPKVKAGGMIIASICIFVYNIVNWSTVDKGDQTLFGLQVTGGCTGFLGNLLAYSGTAVIEETGGNSIILIGVGVLLRITSVTIALSVVSSNAKKIDKKRYLPILS